MPFCTKCGNKIEVGDVFCGVCGAVVPLADIVEEKPEPKKGKPKPPREEPTDETEGMPAPEADVEPELKKDKVKRCPACGEIVGEKDFTCSSCGFELRDSTDGSIGELYRRLEEIENSRPAKKINKGAADSAIDNRKANAIQNFPIPNTKEDLIEFLVMADANSRWDDENGDSEPVSSAWRSKFNQAFNKAEMLFGNECDFERFRKAKAEGEGKAMRSKLLNFAGVIGFLALVVLMWVAFIQGEGGLDKGLSEENTRLQGVLSQVYESIDEGDYAQARKEISGLVYSKSTSNSDAKEAAERWEEIRKETLELINQKERGE